MRSDVRQKSYIINFDKSLAVIIPCFNEENTILQVIHEVHTILPQATIYVFDNNSTDNSKALVESIIQENATGGGGAHLLTILSPLQILAQILFQIYLQILTRILILVLHGIQAILHNLAFLLYKSYILNFIVLPYKAKGQ